MRQPDSGDSNGNPDADPRQYRAFSQGLIYMIWNATDTGHLRATCDAIHFVVDMGMMFPRVLDFSGYANRRPLHTGLMEFMLAPFCPASILELFLKQLSDQGLTLKSPSSNQVYRSERTEISTFMYELFRCHFDPCPSWRLEDPHGIADNFGDKVKALIKYNSVDDGEERVLKDIWISLGKMARKRIERGSLDFDQDGLWFWYELNMSVAYLATDRTVLKRAALDRQGFRRPEAATIHVFEHHNEKWYPPEKLCFVRKMRAEENEPIDPSKYKDRTTGDWYNMPLRDWDFFLVPKFSDCKGYLEHKATEDAWARLRRMRDGVPDYIPY
ncbi:hypothetical protein FGADI_8763 [Fusarium gaditjirri]|uniref:Uncharacterized protein n=1 Tax=Fusarium gaditjirri TaxID=282569 RepID=A0A8H4WTS9_9HYPO|nr:hypothetical protein FGADI_8763 [Fusarium gaditjirri]